MREVVRATQSVCRDWQLPLHALEGTIKAGYFRDWETESWEDADIAVSGDSTPAHVRYRRRVETEHNFQTCKGRISLLQECGKGLSDVGCFVDRSHIVLATRGRLVKVNLDTDESVCNSSRISDKAGGGAVSKIVCSKDLVILGTGWGTSWHFAVPTLYLSAPLLNIRIGSPC